MPTKYVATGRPNGRPLGRRNSATLERERIQQELKATAFADLTEEQILAITPADMFRLVALAAVRAQDLPFILKAAEAWAPYEMPRLASEVHRVFNDDSKRSVDALNAELADIRRAKEDAAKAARRDADAVDDARAAIGAGEVEEGMSEQSHGVVH